MRGPAKARIAYDSTQLIAPTWKSAEPIAQAERQAQWLAKWLTSATGDRIAVTAAIALPGWFVDRKGRGAVRDYNHRELGRLLELRTAQRLAAVQVQRVVHQLDQRCRNVPPLHRPDDDSVAGGAAIPR